MRRAFAYQYDAVLGRPLDKGRHHCKGLFPSVSMAKIGVAFLENLRDPTATLILEAVDRCGDTAAAGDERFA